MIQLHMLHSGGGGNVYTAELSDGPVDPMGAVMSLPSGRDSANLHTLLTEGPAVLKVAIDSNRATRREAKRLRELAHPHILPILALVQETFRFQGEEIPVVGMLLPRAVGTLDAWRARTLIADRRRAIPGLLRSLLSAVAHVHALHWLHGDLHILNVLELEGRWVVCDLDVTRAGSSVRCLDLGTPFWSRAPEVTRWMAWAERAHESSDTADEHAQLVVRLARERVEQSTEPIVFRQAVHMYPSRAVDLWAIGMVVYRVATDRHWLGLPPCVTSEGWVEHPLAAELAAISRAESTTCRLQRLGCGDTVRRVLEACLQTLPSKRTTSSKLLALMETPTPRVCRMPHTSVKARRCIVAQ